MQKIVSTIATALFFFNSTAEQTTNINVSVGYTCEQKNFFRCELILVVPSGWKLANAPDISVLKSKNLKNFSYDGNFEQLNKTTYKASFSIVAEDELVWENLLELQVDCPLCKDICTVVSRRISIALVSDKVPSRIFILSLGFLGGLFLNAMPCVLPIILIRLKSFISIEALCGSIVGNYASFAAFGSVLAFLKMSGEAIGWGMHFQNPYFLELATCFLFCLALYSFGIFAWYPSIKTSDRKYRTFWVNFLANMTACAIAIPCTAPFLGSTAAFAIQGTVEDLYLTFFAIATGLSIPYILAMFLPVNVFVKLASYGNIVKKTTNIGAIIVFLWFFWLLSRHLSPIAISLYGASFAALTLLLWKKKYIIVAAVTVVCFCCWTQREFISFHANGKDPYEDIEARIEAELAKKRIVIFNITADWCLTCKYNQRVFQSEKVRKSMKDNNVKFMEADMTKKSDALTKFINARHRIGIPFTIVYNPHISSSGVMLSEILTEDAVMEAIEKAGSLNR
ncbi:MAG: thioredoxin family protein [Holosporaceae bacterium]|nr:thioredoxin family protein [Holosporaceae bacterium]